MSYDSFVSYHLPLMWRNGPEQPDYLPTGFALVEDFKSREGHVQLVKTVRSPGKLRIIKSVEHNDRKSPPGEARALGNLPQLHTNIIRLFCCDLNPTCGYAQMLFEHCSGGDLFQQSNHRRVTPLFALHVVISVAEALAFLHYGLVHREGYRYERVSHGGNQKEAIVHQDIKADNVFLRFPGSQGGGLPDVVLADFGLANPDSKTVPGIGCVPFMSPECRFMKVERLTHKTDIYSFGVMCIGLFDHQATHPWNVYKLPRFVRLDCMYDGLHLTPLLMRCVVVDAADRGDFSEHPGTGMLGSIAEFRSKRTSLLQHGKKHDKSYWASNR
jgi:serine/threonine protein kinase